MDSTVYVSYPALAQCPNLCMHCPDTYILCTLYYACSKLLCAHAKKHARATRCAPEHSSSAEESRDWVISIYKHVRFSEPLACETHTKIRHLPTLSIVVDAVKADKCTTSRAPIYARLTLRYNECTSFVHVWICASGINNRRKSRISLADA